jgi:hypothetical protein
VPGLGGIFGNDTLQQIAIWGVGQQVIGAAVGPYLNALTAEVNSLTPIAPLSPDVAAGSVIRNLWPVDRAASEAAMSGVNRERFDVLVGLSGDAPAPQELAVALRRGLIDAATYQRGIRQGRLRDEWSDLIQRLAVQEPSPIAILQAYLEGQVDEGTARSLYAKLGGAPDYFDILYNSQGSAPTPTEAAEMARRGVIPWGGRGAGVVSFEQAFLEGPWRNKWQKPFRTLAEYLPPPRTVTAMYREGSLSRSEALDLLVKQGLTPDLAAAYLQSGSDQKTAPTKDLAQSTVTTLYRDRLISRGDAQDMLVALKYDATEADFILQIEDVRVAERFLSSAVARVHTLYVGHKISRSQATSVLAQLQLPAGNVTDLVAVWDYERAANVRGLQPSEVFAAFRYQIVDQPTAQQMLVELGYLPHDAWLYLSVHHKGKLPDEPPASDLGPAPGP